MKRVLIMMMGIALIFSVIVFDALFREDQVVSETAYQVPGLISDPDVSIFAGLVHEAGLDDIFAGVPLTGFIPTNHAFEKLGKKQLEQMRKPRNRDALTTFLINHIMHGSYMSRHLTSRSYQMISGKEVEVIKDLSWITVNDQPVLRRDVTGPNGVVHLIDTVLVRP